MIELKAHQKEAVKLLQGGKHFLIMDPGTGKTIASLDYARKTGKRHVIIVTTPSVRDSKGFEKDAALYDKDWYSQSSFTVLSWGVLAKWLKNQTSSNQFSLDDCFIIFDEVSYAKAGVSSQRGKAFLTIAKFTDNWIGLTATPGDKWEQFYPYLVSCGLCKNKSKFWERYCNVQTYKGYPEIVGYKNEEELKRLWYSISCAPDTSMITESLPKETNIEIPFKAPVGYKQVYKTHVTPDGEILDNPSKFRHYLQQMCGTAPAKIKWLEEFLDTLPYPCAVFYTYKAEAEAIKCAVNRLDPKRRVWQINGQSHEIPTADSIGPRDVVAVQWQAGGMGLNLQFINYWLCLSPCYSYSMAVQGKGRIKRIGQAKPMFFYFLPTKRTIEEDIYACLHIKKDFAKEAWDIKNY